MTDPDDADRLKRLEARLDALKGPKEVRDHKDEHYSQAHLAWRMVIEMVAGLLIGFGMGYGLDALFGTIPIFLVIFTLLGLAAGIKTMMRSAREIQRDAELAETGRTAAGDNGADRIGRDERAKDGD